MIPDTNTQKKILVIEDDRDINASLQRKFQTLGFATEGAFNGQAGFELLKMKVYDGIMLDLMMPIKDGFAVMAQLHGTPNKQTPVYVLTSVGEESKVDLAWDLGAKMVFKKEERGPAEVAQAVNDSIHSLHLHE
ncbi:MAG: response regulator [Planctomycetota bacterium]